MTQEQAAALLSKMDALTQQVQTSAQYQAEISGRLLVACMALLAALLIVTASRPFWRR